MAKNKNLLNVVAAMIEDIEVLKRQNVHEAQRPAMFQFAIEMRSRALALSVQAHHDFGLKDDGRSVINVAKMFMHFLQNGE